MKFREEGNKLMVQASVTLPVALETVGLIGIMLTNMCNNAF
jgi:hypothetical protein